jgi:hypothetical protein
MSEETLNYFESFLYRGLSDFINAVALEHGHADGPMLVPHTVLSSTQ